jgi:flagellar basal-body rod protein FlgF
LVRGLYTAASGALVAQSQADNVANNLANVNSNGFKQTLLQVQSAPTLDIYRIQTDPGHASGRALPGRPVAPRVGSLGTGSQVYDTPEDFSQGTVQQTGNHYDVALMGANAFFSILTPQGVRYTRDGQFTLNANGNLVTADGSFVLGQNNAPLQLQQAMGPATISPDGTVSQSGPAGQGSTANQIVGKIGVTSFGNLLALRKQGDNMFYNTGAAQPGAAPAVAMEQGALEKSNGNVVRSMVDLITAERWFDANEKVIKAEDDATTQDITNVARPTS